MKRWQSAVIGGTALRWNGTCAVVGSSNSLMHTARGLQIDAAAAVFRCNAAPTIGYERHVGRRTTLRFWGVQGAPGTSRVVWGSNSKLPAASEPDTVPAIVCPPVKWVDRCWRELDLAADHNVSATLTPSQRRASSAPRLSPTVKFALREQIRAAYAASGGPHRSMKYGQHPTTGAIATYVAIHACDSVALYGFGNCTKTALQRSKYYDRHQGRKSYMRNLQAHHDLEAEHQWMRMLVRRGLAVDHEGCMTA